MKQIENLIVVEVPKGYDYMLTDTHVAIYRSEGVVTARTHYIPFPCEIIGLASEIGPVREINVLNAAKTEVRFRDFISTHSLTSPDKDYLFLKKKI